VLPHFINLETSFQTPSFIYPFRALFENTQAFPHILRAPKHFHPFSSCIFHTKYLFDFSGLHSPFQNVILKMIPFERNSLLNLQLYPIVFVSYHCSLLFPV